MKWTITLLVLLGVVVCGLVTAGYAQERVGPAPRDAYALSGPFTHDNLTLFLIHGADRLPGVRYLTLQQALEEKRIIVHETGNVNELAVENVGDRDVFIQSGDIVKGGRQDRTISLDFICPPKSGKMAIASFCVEHGRWQQRGAEAPAQFQSSANALSSKGLKIAAKQAANQQQVWSEVSVAQERLSSNSGKNVAAPESASSLELSLEDAKVKQLTDTYVTEMSQVVEGKGDVIGFVFAINGQINSADVYCSHDLFMRLWPKMLRAACTEALAELKKGQKTPEVKLSAVGEFLRSGDSARETETKQVTPRVTVVTREAPGVIMFETRDGEQDNAWIHRNYLTPEEKKVGQDAVPRLQQRPNAPPANGEVQQQDGPDQTR